MRDRLVDHHVHLYPPEVTADPAAWAQACGERQWATLCARRRKDGRPVQGFPTVEELLRAMDAGGIEQAVLLGWYWENASTCEWQNRFYAECRRAHPDRIRFFATVHPDQFGPGLREVLVRSQEQGCEGVGELSPHTQGLGADWDSLFALAGDLRLAVNLHVTEPGGRPYPGRTETPLEDFLSWARKNPGTRFVLAHWGGGLASDPAALALPNVVFDTAASPLTTTAEQARACLAAAGIERVYFGSDYPLELYPTQRDADFGLVRWASAFRDLTR